MSRSLTRRERQILRAYCDGRPAAEIAVLARVSESTVEWHIANAARKLNASSRPEAVLRAYRAGLLDDTPALKRTAAQRTSHRRAVLQRLSTLGRAALRAAVVGAILVTATAGFLSGAPDVPAVGFGPLQLTPPLERLDVRSP